MYKETKYCKITMQSESVLVGRETILDKWLEMALLKNVRMLRLCEYNHGGLRHQRQNQICWGTTRRSSPYATVFEDAVEGSIINLPELVDKKFKPYRMVAVLTTLLS
jgi:hypothetical protein